jgi:hypothetical protein
MAITIIATAGSASANSFVTLAEAASYMEGRLNATSWETTATTDQKNRALVEATRELSNKTYIGERADTTQALAWPRQMAHDPDSPNADFYASTVVPQRVKDATCELAFQFIKAGSTDVAALDANYAVKRKRIDVIETEYDNFQRKDGLARYPSVLRFIKPLLVGTGVIVPIVRG